MAGQNLGANVRAMYQAWNAKDLERCASYTAPGARMTNVPFGASLGFREYIENWARAFPDGEIEVATVVEQGDRVIAECIGRGTHTGVLMGPTGDLPPTHRRMELPFVESFRFSGDKLVEGRIYFDAFSMFTQLGVGAPAGATAGARAQDTAH